MDIFRPACPCPPRACLPLCPCRMAVSCTARWYYDPKTQWYYGGEPTPEWSQSPPLPAAAMFGVAPHEGGPVAKGTAGAGAAAASGAVTSGRLDGLPMITKTVQRVVAVPKHPLADVGGYKAPTTGRIGGHMGAGTEIEGGDGGAAKRKREEHQAKGGGTSSTKAGAVSAEEAEALARREAARQRVAQRTAAGFGYL
ncbi:hypothetical protein Vretimale_11475 [Volvox reticuliferus]|uniref:Uncharacterized protein n=1 Tax=Volvox reticuliferus TaxID=1737510 RepID=A0A8J4GI76_9CHLO|nr:hypothetical protein Vretimale_11475 [Volvox reticuliferus]